MSVSIFGFAQTPNTNNIATKTYRVSTTTSISNPQVEDAFEQIVYFDGLGRPIQKVAYQQSSSGKDIISHIEYDQMGRKAIDYLPYVRSNASRVLDGSALSNNLQFYANNYITLTGNDYFSTTLYPFAEKKYDNSPLNRVVLQSAPGEKWAVGSNHEIQFNYHLNQTSDQVKYFKTNEMNIISQSDGIFTAYNVSLIDNGFFDTNQLYKTTTKDENWTSGNNNTTIEFKNRLGQVILKRTFENNEKYDTYYVYDRHGNLSFVIPPKVDTNNTITEEILDGLCYQYKYDYKNRLVEKKLPGKQWEYIVYDRLDRVVASGPTLNPFGENGQGWLITKYDKFNRAVYTAWRIQNTFDTNTRKSHQHSVYNSSPSQSEVKSAQLVTINNVQVPYTNVVFPTDNLNVLSINYYDDYSHTVAPGNIPTTISNQTVMQNLKGLSTGSWVRVLTSSSQVNAETTYLLYDKYGRTIFSKTNNHLGGFTEVTSNLDFEGKPLNTILVHRLDINSEVFQVEDEYTYLPNGKLAMHIQKVNNEPKELIAAYTYDELGNLVSKNVGGDDISNAIGYQKIDYKYNIRGWLTDINNVFDLNESIGLERDYFAFKINYEKLTHTNESGNVVPLNSTAYDGKVKPLFNGNIAETYWITSTDNNIRKYSYSYDDMNRLLEAFYQRPQQNIEQTNNYNEFIRYDKNGNITELKRNGATDGLYVLEMDDLRYDYQPNSNFLLKVIDSSNAPQGFKDDSVGNEDPEDDYAYDAYGNLKIDQNKKITKIVYNHLNLPTAIYFLNGSYIIYLYNANGVKIRKTVFDANFPNSGVAVTEYQNGFQYLNNRLLFFPHTEGYVNYKEGIFSYVYQYKDHLGSIRLAFAKEPSSGEVKILNEDHYYPFGLKHENYNTNIKYFEEDLLSTTTTILKIRPVPPAFKNELYNYKYNGKEWQDELGLNVTAMDFRMYDNALGRFHNIDVMTEVMPSLSPYRFAFNNPVIWKDPSGLSEESDVVEEHWDLDEVVLTATRKSTKSVHDTGLPYNHSYFLMPKNYRPVSTDYYNKKYGTDFKNLDDWYYRTKYLPFKEEMIKDMHSAQAKAGMAVMALVGSAFATPFLVASSPAAISAVSATISNPVLQTSVANSLIHAGLQQTITGKVDFVDAAIAGAPGGSVIQALKPAGMALFDLTEVGGFQNTFDGSKNFSSTFRDASTGYLFFGLGFGVTSANSLNSFNQVPLNGVLNSGDILINEMLKSNGIE